MKRCSWVNDNPLYIKYHDDEWGVESHDDYYLFEMLVLEMFQAGLSWECVLNKREAFRISYNNFDYKKIALYDEDKINELLNNSDIIRNRLKIEASINNAKIFIDIRDKYGSFDKYIWSFTNNKIIYNEYKTTLSLSDEVAKDLKNKGMKFLGSTIIYSYLQAIGVINDHEVNCFKHVIK